jgi:hypothetical protein
MSSRSLAPATANAAPRRLVAGLTLGVVAMVGGVWALRRPPAATPTAGALAWVDAGVPTVVDAGVVATVDAGVVAIVAVDAGVQGMSRPSAFTPKTLDLGIEAPVLDVPPADPKLVGTTPPSAPPSALSLGPKPVETTSTDAPPVEAKPVEAKPVEPKPVEPKPVEPKPVVSKPVVPRRASLSTDALVAEALACPGIPSGLKDKLRVGTGEVRRVVALAQLNRYCPEPSR